MYDSISCSSTIKLPTHKTYIRGLKLVSGRLFHEDNDKADVRTDVMSCHVHALFPDAIGGIIGKYVTYELYTNICVLYL